MGEDFLLVLVILGVAVCGAIAIVHSFESIGADESDDAPDSSADQAGGEVSGDLPVSDGSEEILKASLPSHNLVPDLEPAKAPGAIAAFGASIYPYFYGMGLGCFVCFLVFYSRWRSTGSTFFITALLVPVIFYCSPSILTPNQRSVLTRLSSAWFKKTAAACRFVKTFLADVIQSVTRIVSSVLTSSMRHAKDSLSSIFPVKTSLGSKPQYNRPSQPTLAQPQLTLTPVQNMKKWFYTKGNQEFGPVDSAELKRLASSGELSPTDLIWNMGLEESTIRTNESAKWQLASSLKGLFQPSAPYTPQRMRKQHRDNSVEAVALIVLLALIVLGGLASGWSWNEIAFGPRGSHHPMHKSKR